MIEQGSLEWKRQRCGKLGASRIGDATAKTKSGWGSSRATLLGQLVAERLTGVPTEGFKSAAMQAGNDREPQARAAYEFYKDQDVVLSDFIDHPRIPMAGCSPDGFVGADGLLEIKCPQVPAHIEMLLTGQVDGRYLKQMLFQMAVTGRAFCDFVSFNPDLPTEMQLFVARFERKEAMIADLEHDAAIFLDEVASTVSALRSRYQIAEAA